MHRVATYRWPLSWTMAALSSLLGLSLLLAACPPRVVSYSPKATSPPPMVNCVESSCALDAKPFPLGGRDYSPPTLANIARWQRAGHFAGLSYDQIQADYRQKDFDWYEDDLRCNCMCRGSKHAAFGGRCLEPPIPGTPLHEAVHLGRAPSPRSTARRGRR